MIWYSLSVSVCAGATVIESPVCTPIASKFSIAADDDAVVVAVANHFHLELFPADEGLVYQQLIGRR